MEKIFAKIIQKIMEQMSDSLRKEILAVVQKLENVAKQTQNPWDDILVLILKVVIGVD